MTSDFIAARGTPAAAPAPAAIHLTYIIQYFSGRINRQLSFFVRFLSLPGLSEQEINVRSSFIRKAGAPDASVCQPQQVGQLSAANLEWSYSMPFLS